MAHLTQPSGTRRGAEQTAAVRPSSREQNSREPSSREVGVGGSNSLPTPLFGAAVVGLTVFFLGLMAGRPSGVGYLVDSSVRFAVFESSNESAAVAPRSAENGVTAHSLSQQEIADAVRAADQQLDRPARSLNQHELTRVAQQLDVRVTEQDGERQRVDFSYEGQDLAWSLAFADSLARQMLVGRPTTELEPTDGWDGVLIAKWRLEQARHYERKARFDMEGALHAQFEIPGDRSAVATGDRVSPENASGSAGGMVESQPPALEQPPTQLNPQWERLQNQLAQLQDELIKMLTVVLPSHPRAQNLEMRIEDMRRQLAGTPKYLVPPDQQTGVSPQEENRGPGRWNSQPVAFTSTDESEPDAPAQELVDVADYLRQHHYYDTTVQRREEAERELASQVALQFAQARSRPALRTGLASPATFRRQVGGRHSGRVVLGFGLLAILSAGWMFWRIHSLKGLTQINSIGDLQATLPLEIVERISIDPVSAKVRRRATWGRCVRWLTRGGELVLAGLVVLFLVSVLTDGLLAKELINNPLGTFVHRISEVSGLG